MKTPTWAIVVGIFLMLFGGCSITKNIQAINLPNIIAMQNEMMEIMTDPSTNATIDSLSNSNEDLETFQGIAEGMQQMFTMSEFTKTWTVRFGYLGLIITTIYIFSGVFLMVKKPFSIKLAYVALVLNIVFSGVQSVVLATDSSGGLMAMAAGFGNVFGIILDLILLVVIISMDKTAYNFQNGIRV
ncbi:MAG: hypothetical protein OCD76_05195 [Reichenbachiella sp.]